MNSSKIGQQEKDSSFKEKSDFKLKFQEG